MSDKKTGLQRLVVTVPVADLRLKPIEARAAYAHDHLQESQLLYNEILLCRGEERDWYYVEAGEQLKHVIDTLKLNGAAQPFTLCLECNTPLIETSEENVAERVPPYFLKTQKHYMECPACRRVYWRGSHWRAMQEGLGVLCEQG